MYCIKHRYFRTIILVFWKIELFVYLLVNLTIQLIHLFFCNFYELITILFRGYAMSYPKPKYKLYRVTCEYFPIKNNRRNAQSSSRLV